MNRPVKDGDVAVSSRHQRRRRKLNFIADRRRFKIGPVPTGEAKMKAHPDAPGTIHPTRVMDVIEGEVVLKDGAWNSKIGGDVLVGHLKGAHIVTLTLEERATCPRGCQHWQTCYGNSMPYPKRWRHGDRLMKRIADEIDVLCERYQRVLVRLHVLGDFWSTGYVDFWGQQLARHGNLYAFGFTAHAPDSAIGGRIAEVRETTGRFWIRWSGRTGPWGCFTIDFPTEKNRIGDAVVCPEQRDMMKLEPEGIHCGACALCWKGDTPIVFIEH